MTGNPINFAGIEIPSDSPVFLAALGMHILVGLSCVVSGIVAMFSRKRPGRHPRFGTIYYYCLSVVFASAAILSAMRWAEDYHLVGRNGVSGPCDGWILGVSPTPSKSLR